MCKLNSYCRLYVPFVCPYCHGASMVQIETHHFPLSKNSEGHHVIPEIECVDCKAISDVCLVDFFD